MPIDLTVLTEKEAIVCRALVDNDGSEKEIAAALGWNHATFHGYIKSAYRKLGIDSRVQLIHRMWPKPIAIGDDDDKKKLANVFNAVSDLEASIHKLHDNFRRLHQLAFEATVARVQVEHAEKSA